MKMNKATQRGLSLVELLLGLGLAGFMLVVAVPGMQALGARSERAAINNSLLATLALARSEALRRRQDTIVCPAQPAASGCRSDGAWHEGWMSFVDANGNGRFDSGESLLQVHGPLEGARLDSGRGRPKVRFARNGMNRGSNLSIRLCQAGEIASAVVLNNGGRARLETNPSALRRWRCG
ncbi:GspH/FimT family protein [Pseudomarimonas salicorniae]|uniref:Type II secretion system protein H n=1 Tax=Pseudomarimonas salicorniae TaxID=2933270 RepID=A0ABT0GFA5_9GAMM|nr:GspH/FimT family protein [Lysobacter sp. CAU 1642]MCK7593224.1 GspH/FimT family pseudopilin [Lysobacter sp. CAU 1642]